MRWHKFARAVIDHPKAIDCSSLRCTKKITNTADSKDIKKEYKAIVDAYNKVMDKEVADLKKQIETQEVSRLIIPEKVERK